MISGKWQKREREKPDRSTLLISFHGCCRRRLGREIVDVQKIIVDVCDHVGAVEPGGDLFEISCSSDVTFVTIVGLFVRIVVIRARA